MIIATNRMNVNKGFAEKMAPRFTTAGPLQQFPGFIKVETTITLNTEEYDELNVNMYWESLEAFEAWKKSDLFKQSHRRPKAKDGEPTPPSPIISNKIIVSKVATSIEAL